VGARELEDAAAVGAAVDEVADEGQAVLLAVVARRLEEVEQLAKAALHVSDDEVGPIHDRYCNRSTRGGIQ
jgi:hypothetical protein